jgi:hypothetical protein
MAYTGQDLIDYEENQYLPLRYYQQNITAPEIMGQTSGITSTGAAQPYVLPGPSTTGGDRGGGFGWFGNLDESNMKMFDKNVWVGERGGPRNMYGGWQPQEGIKGYMNVNTGQYQTKEGKNINHLGLEVPSIIGMIGNKLTGQKFGEPQVGDIEGLFTHGTKSGMGKIKEGWDDEKEKWSNALGIKKWREKKQIEKQIELEKTRAAEEKQAAALATHQQAKADRKAGAHSSQVQLDPGSGGTWREQTAAKERQGVQVHGPGGGSGAYFADGGRVRFFYGGLAGIL